MEEVISEILKEMADYDQAQRRSIIQKYGESKEDSTNKYPFYELKGASTQRFKVVKLLVKYDALETADDYYYAASILVNSKNKKDYFLALWLNDKAVDLGNKKQIKFLDKYYEKRGWKEDQIKEEYKIWLKRNKGELN